MCLAPEVDVVAAAAITVVAVDALRHCRNGRVLPLALLPGIFAVHTLSSAFVWWGARGTVPPAVGDAAAVVFMAIAFVLLPVYLPVSVLLLEPHGWRRTALLVLSGAGAMAAADFLVSLVSGPSEAIACDFYINYYIADASAVAGALYVVATCGALLLSGLRPLFAWGVANALAVTVLLAMSSQGLPSLWCFWAACTSVFVAWYLRRLDAARDRGQPWPWEGSGPDPLPDRLPAHVGGGQQQQDPDALPEVPEDHRDDGP